MSEKKDAQKKPSTLRITDEMQQHVVKVSDLTGLAQADVMRMALAIGLEDLRRIDYDLAGAVVDAANLRKGNLATEIPGRTPLAYPKKSTLLNEETEPKRKSGT